MLSYGSVTDRGLIRDTNEDNHAAFDVLLGSGQIGSVFVIADGMGAAAGGEAASRLTVERFSETARCGMQQLCPDTDSTALAELLEAGICTANAAVRRQQKERPKLKYMATTCAAMLTWGDQAAYGNAGDSRIYILRRGRMTQLSIDHVSFQGRTGSHQTDGHLHQSITRGVGFTDCIAPDVGVLTLQSGDTLLFCTDGLTNNLEESEIARLLAMNLDPQTISKTLVDAAKGNGGDDNITVVVCRYGEHLPAAEPLAASEEHESEANPDSVTADPHLHAKQRRFRRNCGVLLTLLFCLLIGSVAYRRLASKDGLPITVRVHPGSGAHPVHHGSSSEAPQHP